MTDNPARRRAIAVRFLSICALLLAVAWTGCEEKTCASSAECATGEICAGPGAGPFHCLKDCTSSGECAFGFACVGLTSADCPTCDVITNACVVAPPRPLRR